MFTGYILAIAPVMATFYNPERPSRVAVVAPLLALSVPLFDTVSVVWIRWRRGESIMKGDKRHFSHRLMNAGMSHRQAVEYIYFVSVITGVSAVLIRLVNATTSILIILQVVGVFGLITLLMHAGSPKETEENSTRIRTERPHDP